MHAGELVRGAPAYRDPLRTFATSDPILVKLAALRLELPACGSLIWNASPRELAMALIKTLKHEPLKRQSIHDEVEASYSAFPVGGGRIVQVNTFGRPGRRHPGTQSQTVQFEAEAARALVDILEREFALR